MESRDLVKRRERKGLQDAKRVIEILNNLTVAPFSEKLTFKL